MGKQQNKVTGNEGERLAAESLQIKGYDILGRNYRSKWGEIDIIAKINNIVVFVEVKTKTTDKFGDPWEMVNHWKVEQVKKIGEVWCREYGWEGRVRMDVIGVWLNDLDLPVDAVHQAMQVGPRIEHWESVDI